MKKIRWMPCFYCGADANLLKWIIITLVGSLLLMSLSTLFWAWRKGMFKNIEDAKFSLFELERGK